MGSYLAPELAWAFGETQHSDDWRFFGELCRIGGVDDPGSIYFFRITDKHTIRREHPEATDLRDHPDLCARHGVCYGLDGTRIEPPAVAFGTPVELVPESRYHDEVTAGWRRIKQVVRGSL